MATTPTVVDQSAPDNSVPVQAPVQAQPTPIQTQDAPQLTATIPLQQAPAAPTNVSLVPPPPNKHEVMGRVLSALMGGPQTQYSVDPQGNTVATQGPPPKPGQVFKSILAAGLLGGMDGANGNPQQGFAGGFARGAGGSVKNAQAQDALARQQAQQQFQDQQKVAQESRENTLLNAQVQNYHSELVGRQHTSDLQDKEAHDKHNAASAALENGLNEAGGTAALIPVNGQLSSTFTAPDLAAAYVKNPSILKGPDGFIRHFIDNTDSSDLTYNGKNWVDDAGQPINMTDKTTVKAIDVPINALKTTQTTHGTKINALAGSQIVDPNKDYQISGLDQINLNTGRMKNEREAAAVDLEKHKVAQGDAELSIRRQELALKQGQGQGTTNAAGNNAEDIADAIQQGRGTFEQLTQGMGKEAASFRREVESSYLKKYPNGNLEALKSYGKQADNSSTQGQLTNARSIFGTNGEPGSFDILESALRRVPKASLPMLSKFKQDTAYNLGSPEMATVKALKTDLGTELAKFNAGGGNATSDHQIELYREQLNEAQTPEQVDRVLQDIRHISSKRLGAIVGANPYLHNMTTDINDPVTKQPRGAGSPQNGQQPSANSVPRDAPPAKQGEQPVWVGGKFAGYTTDGKSFTYQY